MTTQNTNIELFGTELESRLKQQSAQTEKAWAMNFSKPGLYIWRVNKFHLDPVSVLQTANDDGLFYIGDSYVVLKINSNKDNSFSYNIHFWLGSQTTQDEAGTAAYKAVELDTLLGNRAVQYRELQNYESDTFLSYFKAGLRYADGGNESGFHHVVKPDRPTLLYWVHDNQVKQIPLVVDDITEDDVFVLDTGDRILIYRGQQSSHAEALYAEYEALDIKTLRPATQIEHVETPAQKQEFLKLVNTQNSTKLDTKLYRISEDGTKVEVSDDHNMSGDDSYIYQTGNACWIWVGSQSNYAEANKAWQVAIKLTKPTDRLRLIRETHEPESFWISFSK